MKFDKPALSIAQQMDLLRSRGMRIDDAAQTAHHLTHISYYRLRAYWLPFETPADVAGEHAFAADTSFDDVMAVYIFDRRLRLHLMDALERIEVALRAIWAHHLAVTYGAHGYLAPELYARFDHYERARATLADEVARSKDTFIAHYKSRYREPAMPPVWMAAEVLSLGQLSKWLANLRARADRQAVARPLKLDEKVLVSIVHNLTYVRNICAHHGRLWNKRFTVTMITPSAPSALADAMNPDAPRKLYNTLAAAGYLLEVVAPGSQWRRTLVELLTASPFIDPMLMGFPPDWRTRKAWIF